MSKIHNNHTGTKEITCVLFKRLPSHSTDSNHNEVLWEVSHAKNREGPHPPLPQSLPAPTIRKTVPEHQSPLHQTAQQLFPPGCESPELRSPRPPLKPHANPLPPETWTANPYLQKHGPPPNPPTNPPTSQPYHTKENTELFFCAIQVCYTQVSGPVQTTCSNTLLYALDTFPTQSHKKLSNICMFTCSCTTTNHLVLFPSQLLTHNVSLCTCTVFMWSIRIVCIVCIFYLYL